MKKIFMIMALLALTAAGSGVVFAGGNAHGPAPNSGDGIPDGSGFDPLPPFGPIGPNGVDATGTKKGPKGPAPNSGDCDPDGSGF